MRKLNHKKGFTLMETLLYALGVALIFIAIGSLLISLTDIYKRVGINENLSNSLGNSMERTVRETRDALSIDTANSTFNTSPGILRLNTTDSAGSPKTVRFYLNNGRIYFDENSSFKGILSASTTVVSSLIFRQIDTGVSDAVKIEMTGQTTDGEDTKTENFYSTVILRESY